MRAKQFIDISDQEIEIIMQSKKSVIFKEGTPWTKKGNDNFDVAMGVFDGRSVLNLSDVFY